MLYRVQQTPICIYAGGRASWGVTMSTSATEITIRPAYADDYPELARLAALDSADRVPARPLLLVEVDGSLRAALSLRDGSAIADPFFPSAKLLVLLRAHAAGEQATRSRARERLRWWARRPGSGQLRPHPVRR